LPASVHVDVVTVSEDLEWASQAVKATTDPLAANALDCASMIRPGDAKHEILAAADELGSDLIVTGARGLGGFAGLFLGSVSRAISSAAACSVLVVVHDGPADD
jgi:nucleotide-binding universal stress UspA family protein